MAFVVDIVAVFGDEVDTGTACIVNLDGESVFVDAISGFERDDSALLLGTVLDQILPDLALELDVGILTPLGMGLQMGDIVAPKIGQAALQQGAVDFEIAS